MMAIIIWFLFLNKFLVLFDLTTLHLQDFMSYFELCNMTFNPVYQLNYQLSTKLSKLSI